MAFACGCGLYDTSCGCGYLPVWLAVVKLLLLLPVLGDGFEVVRDVGGACQVLHVCVRPKQVHQVVKVPGGVAWMNREGWGGEGREGGREGGEEGGREGGRREGGRGGKDSPFKLFEGGECGHDPSSLARHGRNLLLVENSQVFTQTEHFGHWEGTIAGTTIHHSPAGSVTCTYGYSKSPQQKYVRM